ncbi:MAG: 1,4-alpha-glucan branching protein domain-containing protein [Nitrospinota bacterium]
MDPKGYLALVFHAHLPYVRHPEYDEFLEEDWLFEAITETYIPLIQVFDGLVRDGVDFRVTMSLTPTLISMLTDPLLQSRYLRHLNKLIELSEKEIERTRFETEFNEIAQMYNWKFTSARELFENRYSRNLITAFKELQDRGNLEIITSGATHGFLPLMQSNKNAVRAQIQIAANNYEKHLGRKPRGIWLPECGYYEGLEEILRECGIRYFFVDTHGILHADPRPKYGVFAPVFTPSGVAAFGRDMESSKQVWSAREGYPGDFVYRDFYRDVGFDLDFDYVRNYVQPTGLRKMTGVKYYRITGKTDHKMPYNQHAAMEKAAEHAGNFMFNREKQVEHLHGVMGGRPPIIVSPYDAELFGHWWYEGPEWINFLLRKLHYDQNTIKTITPSEYLDKFPRNQKCTPSMSSWGYKGYAEYWLDGSNDWLYAHLVRAADRMTALAQKHLSSDNGVTRTLNQAARELVLAQSSDWAFIIKTGTMVEYAVKRTKDHLWRFNKLADMIDGGYVDYGWLGKIEEKDNLFPEIDFRTYA